MARRVTRPAHFAIANAAAGVHPAAAFLSDTRHLVLPSAKQQNGKPDVKGCARK